MLITCPECELMLSDLAAYCPHCGYPMGKATEKPKRQSKRRMRLPNGFGQITEITSRRLRKPWRAQVPAGKTPEGKPKSKLLGYYSSYNEAYAALVEYNKNPYDLDTKITLEKLYEEWSVIYFKKLKNPSSERSITSAWDKCSAIYKMRVSDIRSRHIKGVMDQPGISPNTKGRIKSMFNLMLDYAVEHEICMKNVARDFNVEAVKEKDQTHHVAFNDDEMALFWKHSDSDVVKMILIQCYGGWRPQELCKIETANVNLSSDFIIGGMKTDAGTDRRVPIHSKIKEFVQYFYNDAIFSGREYLFDDHITYDIYRHRFKKALLEIGIDHVIHKAHDPRKTFITMAKKYGLDEYAIKFIVGHQVSDITEAIYTERDPSWLNEEIEKIK